MIELKVRHAKLWGVLASGCLAMQAMGCQAKNETSQAPAPAARTISLAVGPAINLSGSTDFDPISLGDLMASELTQLSGVRVVGVNRVLAMMAELGLRELQSPEDVFELADRLGTDGVLVFAVTEYDPYDPPVMGLSAQVFLLERANGAEWFDPVTTSRSATAEPWSMTSGGPGPQAEVQRVFNGAHDATASQVKHFAKYREAERSPLSWRKYLASQQHFFRFCCHSVARELVDKVQYASSLAGRVPDEYEERIP